MKKTVITFAALQAIASANQAGFTYDAKTLQPIKKGFAVAIAETQNSFGANGAKKVIQTANKRKDINAFGGWYNTENKKYYFYAVIVCDNLQTAIEIGKANKQIAVFDLENLQEIRL